MRYTLHAADGTQIGQADTAQRAGDIATHRTVTVDHMETQAYRFTVWERSYSPCGLLGTPYMTSAEAFRAAAALAKDE